MKLDKSTKLANSIENSKKSTAHASALLLTAHYLVEREGVYLGSISATAHFYFHSTNSA